MQTPAHTWGLLHAKRSGMLSRLERLSALTVPSVLPEDSYDVNNEQLTNGHNSLGAQCSMHLTNKIMMTLFAPSRPFMRLELPLAEREKIIAEQGTDDAQITAALANGERKTLAELERGGQRQTLFECLLHLVVVGNGCLDFTDKTALRFIGLRNYAVRRAANGDVAQLIIREAFKLRDLDPEVVAIYMRRSGVTDLEQTVHLYRDVNLAGEFYRESRWVDDVQLPTKFSGKYKRDNLPYRVLTWRLPYGQDYGVGRCEEYGNDLAEHEVLCNALSDGAALASTFRWLASPTGLTQPEDVTNSENGAVIPGAKGDLDLLSANIGQQLATVVSIREDVSRRLGQGFLLNSSVVRNAERVTAEEVRLQAVELESSLGGTYSRLALDIQKPLALYLIRQAGLKIAGTQVEPVVITGLDALSRNSDRERLMLMISDIASLDGLSPTTRARLKLGSIIEDLAAANGVDRGRYIASEQEAQAALQAEQQDAINQQAAAAGAAAAMTEEVSE